MTFSILLLLFSLALSSISGQALDPQLLKDGSIAQFWAQYSPYFSAPAKIDAATPSDCKITFVQVLSRHSARDPSAVKIDQFVTFLDRIRSSVTQYSEDTKFIEKYNLNLGAEQLTPFGEKEAIDSGISFYKRYQELADENDPFIRSVKEDRVVLTANLWKRGVYHSRTTGSDHQTNGHHQQGDGFVPRVHTMSKAKGFNNTLSFGVCTAFVKTWETRGKEAQARWLKEFTRPIIARLEKKLPGLKLTAKDTALFMQLCPMNTVVHGKESPFCDLFTKEEWKNYKYLETLGKYYGWSLGNPLGSTQGVGFTNELIARLTGQPVNDHTSTNSTLTGNPKTFPLDKKIYADFSQGNIIPSSASGLQYFGFTLQEEN